MNLYYYTSTLNNNDELLDLFKEFNSEDFNIYNELSPLVRTKTYLLILYFHALDIVEIYLSLFVCA